MHPSPAPPAPRPAPAALIAPWPQRWRGTLVDLAWVGVFVLVGGVSTLFNPGASPDAPLWMPTGVALGLALVWGARALPAFAAGVFIAHVGHGLSAAGGLSPGVLSAGLVETLAELVVVGGAATWIRRRHPAYALFDRVRHLFGYLAVAGVVFPALGGAVLVAGGLLGLALPMGVEAEHWIAARSASAVLIAPAITAVLHGERPRWTRTAALQVGTVFAFAVAAPLAVWSGWPAPPVMTALLVALAPPVIWLGMVMGRRVSLGAMLVATAIALVGSELGGGPFPADMPRMERVLQVQFLHACLAYGSLYLAIANRRREEQLRAVERDASRLDLLNRTDPLTGLWNRRHLDAHLATTHLRLSAGGPGFAVLMLDVDHFKRVNDAHGHAVGDAVLSTLGRVLREGVRDSDVVGRWGGEEFIIVLDACDAEAACRVAESLRAAAHLAEHPTAGAITLSVGVSVATAGEPVAGLVARADEALYRAKRGGRDRVVCGG